MLFALSPSTKQCQKKKKKKPSPSCLQQQSEAEKNISPSAHLLKNPSQIYLNTYLLF